MALPKLNVTQKFELKVPSTGKKHKFRPYLVKEEKILLLAFESKDIKQITDAMVETIQSCTETDLNVNNLTTFDVEYLFTQIRAKSVGEVVTLNLECEHCKEPNEVKMNIEDIKVDMPRVSKTIKITDEISVEMKWPSYKDIMNEEIDSEELSTEAMFGMILKCMSAILTEEERFDVKDSSKEELMEFLESLTTVQFGEMSAFLEKMPKMKADVDYVCEKCGEKNTLKLEGMSDFF